LIINRKELIRFHNDKSTRLALTAIGSAIDSVKPETLVKRSIRLVDENSLEAHDINGNVSKAKFDQVYVVGAGKATGGMADALCSILKKRIAEAAITVPHNTKIKNNKIIAVTEAAHPVPDRSGIVGTKRILGVLEKAKQDDLIFVLISGGGSALMPMPAPGLSLSDKQKITSMLLRSGASILEMNVVRKHLSAVKGGQLLRYIHGSCPVISLILSDVIDDDLATISSGPTYADNSTFNDALKILKKYHLTRTISQAVRKHLEKGINGEIKDTPKPDDQIFSNVHNMIIGNNIMACKVAANYLQQNGLRTEYLGSRFDGEARDFGEFLARLASDLDSRSFAIVAGGETTVKLNKSKNGKGGRNQEAALAYAIELGRRNTITTTTTAAAFIGTDGIDGNSDAAGALISKRTILSMSKKKMKMRKYLGKHDSYHALKKTNSLIFTGYTGTNVNDIALLINF
jgi:glycerate 2-kinase